MLKKQVNGLIGYCKVSGFKVKSIESVSISLNKFKFRKLHSLVGENVVTAIPYPKNRENSSTVLTIDEYNKILSHCSQKDDTRLGMRNLVIILMLGLLGLRTGTIISHIEYCKSNLKIE